MNPQLLHRVKGNVPVAAGTGSLGSLGPIWTTDRQPFPHKKKETREIPYVSWMAIR